MNKSDLIRNVAHRTGASIKDAEKIINAMLDTIVDTLRAPGDCDVSLKGFGTFAVKDRAERIGRNPQTGEPVNIAASRSVKFKATKGLV